MTTPLNCVHDFALPHKPLCGRSTDVDGGFSATRVELLHKLLACESCLQCLVGLTVTSFRIG